MKTIFTTIALVVLVLGIAPIATATPDSNSIIQDDIEYYIQTDKSVYNLSEDVDMLYRVTNLGSEEWKFIYMPPILDIIVTAKEGGNSDTIWFWSWDKTWPAGPAVRHLQPGESLELNGIWPQIDLNDSWEIEDDVQVSSGIYGIGGRIGRSGFNDMISNAPITLEITIVPEPATFFLLTLGVVFLKKLKK